MRRAWLAATLLSCVLSPYMSPAFAQAVDVQVSVTNTPAQGPGDLADDTYAGGGRIAYTVQVLNAGPTVLDGARVSVPLPDGITGADWSCRAENGARCGNQAGRGAIEDTVYLPVGRRVTYRFEIPVASNHTTAHPRLDVVAMVTLPGGVRASDPGRLQSRDSDLAQRAGLPPPQGETAMAPVLAPTMRTPSPHGGNASTLLGAAVAPGPLPTCGPEMFISQGPSADAPTTLSQLDISAVPFVLNPLGTGTYPYNAVGFRPADNFLYGIRIGTNRLVRIYNDGSTELLDNVTNLPSSFPSPPVANSYNAGEIGTDGFLYVKTQSAVNAIYRIDLSNLPAATATRIPLTGGTVSGADFAWINNRLYTVNQNGTVAWIDPATGAVTTLPVANGDLGNVGALFGTPNGLYGSRNSPGGFYQFDITTGRATRLSGAPDVGTNDGAHCASAAIVLPVDVGVTKTNTPAQGPDDLPNDVYIPGTNVVYTIVVSNRGPTGIQGLRVQDPLPPDIATATWTCAITQGAGNCATGSGTGPIDTTVDLEFNESTRIVSQATLTLTISVPVDYALTHPALTNTTTIVLPPGYVDPTPDDHTATDSDTAATVDLRVLKTTPQTSVHIGDTISYTLTAENLGPIAVTNALLSDTPNSNLDCTSPTEPPTCVATGTAACPASLSRTQLFGTGLIIPTLPANNGSVMITVSCIVTE